MSDYYSAHTNITYPEWNTPPLNAGCGLCGPNTRCICGETGQFPKWYNPDASKYEDRQSQQIQALTEMVIALTEHIANLEDRLGPLENVYEQGAVDEP